MQRAAHDHRLAKIALVGTGGPGWLRTPDDVNALLPQLWPSGVARAADGALAVGGLGVRALAEEFGTPAYVLDEGDLRSRCREFQAAFPDEDVYYAGKAFLCRAVVRVIAEEGLHLDVCTGGELAVALSAAINLRCLEGLDLDAAGPVASQALRVDAGGLARILRPAVAGT